MRAKVYGDWACWDQFDVAGCLTTNLPQSSQLGTADDCATTAIVVLRDQPPEDAEIEPPPANLQSASLLARIGTPACSDTLFEQYAEKMAKYYELSNTVHITDYYTYDFLKWVWGTVTPGSKGNGLEHITNAARQEAYFGSVKAFIEHCEARSGYRCWELWWYQRSPWDIDIRSYQNEFMPYFWNPYGRSGAENYLKFKNDPQGFTQAFFNYECAGIATGSVCSQINYDLNRVPELATNIRNVLANKQYGSPLAAKISPYGVDRCLNRGYPPLQRVSIDANGKPTAAPEDGAFFTQYLNQMCEKGKYKADADAIWNQIVNSCTYAAAPFADSGAGIYAGSFIPGLYRTYDTGYKLGLKGVVEGGILNEYVAATALQQFKLDLRRAGTDLPRVRSQERPRRRLAERLRHLQDVDAGAPVQRRAEQQARRRLPRPHQRHLAHHLQAAGRRVRAPRAARALEGEGEVQVSLEAADAVPHRALRLGRRQGRAASLGEAPEERACRRRSRQGGLARHGGDDHAQRGDHQQRARGRGRDRGVGRPGAPPRSDDRRLAAGRGGAKWNLAMPSRTLLNFTFAPYVKTTVELHALGGSLNGYTRWKIGNTSENTYPIVEWDPLDIGGLLGQEWVLVKHTWDVSGSKAF